MQFHGYVPKHQGQYTIKHTLTKIISDKVKHVASFLLVWELEPTAHPTTQRANP